MKWVGKITLVLLTVMTLFTAKQISPQTDTVQAQSQQDLTVGFNNLEVVVQKDDNSAVQYPNTGFLDYRSFRVYFNGITITNPTSQTAYIRARAQLTTANGWSQCIRDCGFTNPPLRINAGQTITLLDNSADFVTANLHASMVAEMALNGVNSMKLQVLVKDNYGTVRANAYKDNVLRWTSVRIKLTQGGQPLSNTNVNFIRQGSSYGDPGNTGGITNGNGQAGMGLIYPPNVTYTVRTGVYPGTPLRDVEITSYDFLDINAETVSLPDLLLDATNMSTIVTRVDSTSFNVSASQLPVPALDESLYGFGSSQTDFPYKSYTFNNLLIKNAGQLAVDGEVCVSLDKSGQKDSIYYEWKLPDPVCSRLLIPAQGTASFPAFSLDARLFTHLRFRSDKSVNRAPIAFRVDPKNSISESNEDNNGLVVNNFFGWWIITVEYHPPTQTPKVDIISHTRVTDCKNHYNKTTGLVRSGPKGAPNYYGQFYGLWDLTTSQRACVQNIYKPHNEVGTPTGPVTEVSLGGYDSYSAIVTFNRGVTQFDIGAYYKDFSNLPERERPRVFSSERNLPGQVHLVLRNVTSGVEYKIDQQNSYGIILLTFADASSPPPGRYQLISISAVAEGSKFNWPEPTFNEVGPYDLGELGTDTEKRFFFSVHWKVVCESFSASRSVGKYCIEGDQPRIDTVKQRLTKAAGLVAKLAELKSNMFPSRDDAFTFLYDRPGVAYSQASYSPPQDQIMISGWSRGEEDLGTALLHELFHYLDKKNSVVGSSGYSARLSTQASSGTGIRIWDGAMRPIAYGVNQGYSMSSPETSNEYFADEFTALCYFNTPMLSQLNNIEEFWRSSFPEEPPPQDLIPQRDNALARLQGKDSNMAVTVPTVATIYKTCSASSTK